jgi:hypothetical protein
MITYLGYGVGIVDIIVTNKKLYNSWKSIFSRCYSPSSLKKRPTYNGCTISEEWHLLSNYKSWYEENYVEGWQIDKDLLFPRNKIYSAETCLFIPLAINSLFTLRHNDRGELPLGVHYHTANKRYRAGCKNRNGKRLEKELGNPTDAHFWYLEKKISVIDSYLNEDYNERIKQGLTNWKTLLQEHLDNRVEFVP